LLLLSSGENKLRWGFRTARKIYLLEFSPVTTQKIFLRKLRRNFSGDHPENIS